MKIIKKENFDSFINYLINHGASEVVGVRKKGNKYIFDKLQNAYDLKLDYDVTILPPKKYFMPPRETLLNYHINNDLTIESVNQVVPRIIIGIHPYDLEAIKQMDKIFKDAYQDQNYLKKRENSVLVGVNIKNVSKWSFAGSMGTATIVDGYDLMLTDIGSTYAIEIGSSKGSELLKNTDAKTEDASREDIRIVEKIKEELKDKFENKLNFPPQRLPELLNTNYENKEFWEKNSKDCYSCGTCNLVCPTCYCFDVLDRIDLNLSEGTRYRQWDGCLLEEFALVAGGENFRGERWARYRHRYMRKGLYIYNRFGDIACVGCGRCSSQCVPVIADPARIFNELNEGEK